MIEASHLSRQFGRTTAVSNVSFTINNNEVVGLLGPNGAGKTTIMRMLSGYLEPTTGSVTVNGENLGQNAYCIQRQLGYLPENLPVYPDMMVADYLDYVATIKGIARSERLRAVKEALFATEMTAHALQVIDSLSRGQKQRVGVAQAVLGRPGFLILDEPTNGLDPHQAEQMRALIDQLSRRATIILSTHIMQEVEAVCDRVLVIRNGQLALDQSLAQLRDCGSMLLRTDAGGEDLRKLLAHLPQVESVQCVGNRENMREYHLQLRGDCAADTAAGNISHCVLQSGARLYQLESQSRHLEDVYREVINDGQ
ncbi:ATP-binding cassette domain-containing protein [Seongchinamella sediminis]|uniref:ATP-binding cassette domain-containing protein n=1 Tax=Seongchinamella sediminis TaxID=2283635 RepID=A0A3L7E4D3_9GAMM|nr:ABC transporter ATP-binding protein [Seongchinamella sediminis]RLQ23423.1 ATP-binding cassette domain-containing protein [Seongchinamella sediminis]